MHTFLYDYYGGVLFKPNVKYEPNVFFSELFINYRYSDHNGHLGLRVGSKACLKLSSDFECYEFFFSDTISGNMLVQLDSRMTMPYSISYGLARNQIGLFSEVDAAQMELLGGDIARFLQ